MQQKQRLEVLSWNQVHEFLIELAKKVNESGFSPDVIVGISRGGLIPSRILSDLLDNPNLASVRVKFYLNINKKIKEPVITQPISAPIEGKTILIVDDVADTGKSLHLVYEKLWERANRTKTLTLFYKPWSCFKPDFYARETSAWIIFPWELYETVKWLGRNIIWEGTVLKEVKEELIRTGFNPSIVKRFVRDLWNPKK